MQTAQQLFNLLFVMPMLRLVTNNCIPKRFICGLIEQGGSVQYSVSEDQDASIMQLSI